VDFAPVEDGLLYFVEAVLRQVLKLRELGSTDVQVSRLLQDSLLLFLFLLAELDCLQLNQSLKEAFVGVLLGTRLDISVRLVKPHATKGPASLHESLVQARMAFVALASLARLQ
jgi:hypothetical protein